MASEKIELNADSVKIYGPKSDGGFTVTFGIGEYEQPKLAHLMLFKQGEIIKLTIEQKSENSD